MSTTQRQPSSKTRTQILNEIIEVYVFPPFTLRPFLTTLLVSVHGPVEPNIILPDSISITIIPITRNLIKGCAGRFHLAPFEGRITSMDRSQFSTMLGGGYEERGRGFINNEDEEKETIWFKIPEFVWSIKRIFLPGRRTLSKEISERSYNIATSTILETKITQVS